MLALALWLVAAAVAATAALAALYAVVLLVLGVALVLGAPVGVCIAALEDWRRMRRGHRELPRAPLAKDRP